MMSLRYCIIIVCLQAYLSIGAQNPIIYTRSFTNLLEKYHIDFYAPVERWLHASHVQQDHFMDYDLILEDGNDIEVRIRILDQGHIPPHPHVEMIRMLASIATNDQDVDISVSALEPEYSLNNYGADGVVIGDFIPKETYSAYPFGRILFIYKKGVALIEYIVLHNMDQLDPYFEMPLRFK